MGTMNEEIYIRDVLPACRVPTLSLYRADEHYREASRYMAELIEGAKLAELPGEAHLPWEGDQASLFREIESFLASLGEEDEPDRVLVTVLFAELVDNEERPARQELRGRYREIVSGCVSRFRGRTVECETGRTLAIFDGPDLVAGSRIEFLERGRPELSEVPGGLELLAVKLTESTSRTN